MKLTVTVKERNMKAEALKEGAGNATSKEDADSDSELSRGLQIMQEP